MGFFRFTVLASGSRGNVSLIQTDRGAVLIDAGLNGRQLEARLQAVGVSMAEIQAVVVTHEHSDHTAGLPVLLKKSPARVLANRMTWEQLGLGDGSRWQDWSTGSKCAWLDLELESFPVSHDACEPVGVRIQWGGRALAVATDLGFATQLVVQRIRGCEVLLLETNHDPALLQADTKRPWSVKQRIANRHGHLSNAAAAELLGQVAGPELKHVFLGHLSEDCNRPELAEQVIAAKLAEMGLAEVRIHRTFPEKISATAEWTL
jgi:phosphoribosyl 1,2-cyclic phosphodiesterase